MKARPPRSRAKAPPARKRRGGTRSSGTQYGVLVDSAADAILTIDARSRILSANRAVERILGWPPEELHGRGLTVLVPERLLERYRASLERHLRSGEKHIPWEGVELCGLHRSGHEVPLEVCFGEFTRRGRRYYTGIIRDISERKAAERAEQALRDSKQSHRLLFEASPLPVWICDTRTLRFLAVNDAAVAHYGYSRDEFLGMTIEDIRPREDIPTLRAHLAMAPPNLPNAGVWRHRKKDGSVIFVEIARHNLPFEGREARLVVARDVTEQRRAEEALRESELRYRLLFDNNPLPMWVFDTETLRFLAVNEAAIRHYGYSREEFLELTIADIRPPEDVPALRAYLRSVGEGFEEVGLWRHRKKDGTLIDVEIAVHGFVSDGKPARLVVAYDVSERLRADREVRALLEIAQRLGSTLDPEVLLDVLVEGGLELVGAESGCAGLRQREGLCLRYGVRTALSTPILDAGGEVLGFFELHNKRDGSPFSPADEAKLLAVSRAASVAIRNALAYQQVRGTAGRARN